MQTLTSSAASGRTAALVAGDALALLVFAAIGRANHGEASGLAAIAQVAETAAPFALAWFAAAALLGGFDASKTATVRSMLGRTALAWLIAWPIGLGLRALIRQSAVPLSFAIVTLLTVLLILGGWRALFAIVERRRAA